MRMLFIGFFIGTLFVILLVLFQKGNKKSQEGIHIKRIHCPNCHEKQEIITKSNPKGKDLISEYVCENCGAKMDKFGAELEK